MRNDNSIGYIVTDIQKAYIKYRESGKTRAEAIGLIRHEYNQELQDDEERIAVLIGLSLSLCKNKELYESIATETICEIQRSIEEKKLYGISETYVSDVVQRLRNSEVYGEEAVYKHKTPYVPDWKTGDTFSHVLTCPRAERLGIKGWLVLLYKATEYVDKFGEYRHLMYVSVCPPDKVPSCTEELQILGFLPMMYMGARKEYFAQIKIKSRRAEKKWELTKVGCFFDIEPPKDQAKENPLTTMPLFEFTRKGENWPAYEDQICTFYRNYINKNK